MHVTILDELKPSSQQRVIDLVQQAGIDVKDWANYKNGEKNPGANPNYCYEWAFSKRNELVVLNLWYANMLEANGEIEQQINFRGKEALSETNNTRISRRQRMEEAVAHAYELALPIRVIVLDSKAKTGSRVTARLLDSIPWGVKSYDKKTGQCTLQRGLVGRSYVDQFSLPAPPESKAGTREVTTTVRGRDPAVRQYALNRAKGKCQLCNTPGFALPNGGTFLETHHVIPLSEEGPDHVNNVVALCPNHHREAHFGLNAEAIRARLLDLLR